MDRNELLIEYNLQPGALENAALYLDPRTMIKLMIEQPEHVPGWIDCIKYNGLLALRENVNAESDLLILYTMTFTDIDFSPAVWRVWLNSAAGLANEMAQNSVKEKAFAPDIEYRWSLKDDEPSYDPQNDFPDPWELVDPYEY